MRPVHVLAVTALVGLAALAFVAYQAQRSASSDAELRRAEALLEPSLLEAPELVGVEAGAAYAMLDGAIADGMDAPRVRGLRDYAGALMKLQTRDLLAASRALDAAEASLGERASLHVARGTLARMMADTEGAEREAAAALALDADAPRALLLDADLALDRGDGARAAVRLDRLIALEPRVGALYNRLGLAREALGDLAGAEHAYRDARRRHSRDPDPLVNLGRVLSARGALDDAAGAYTDAIELAPGRAEAYLGRGLLHVSRGAFEAARADLARASELAPERAVIEAAWGDLERTAGALDGAIAHYRKAVRIDDASAALWVKLGNALLADDAREDALEAYTRAIAIEPLAAAHNGEGVCLLRLGRPEEAIVAFQTAIVLDPDDPNPARNLSWYYQSRGGPGDAPAP